MGVEKKVEKVEKEKSKEEEEEMITLIEAQVKLPLAALVQTFLIAPIAHSTVASWQRQDQTVATNWAVNNER